MVNPMVKKAEAAVAAARLEVKRLKVLLKQARKTSKSAKKLLKEARRKAKAETAADAKAKAVVAKAGVAKAGVAKSPASVALPPLPKAARNKAVAAVPAITVSKTKTPRGKSTQTLRSAADVAKSVIERLESPPPVLAPPPIIPPAAAVLPDSGSGDGDDGGEQAAKH